MLLYLFRFSASIVHILYEKEKDRDYISQDTCLKLLPVITRNDKWSGRLFYFVNLFSGYGKKTASGFRDIAVADGIV